MLRKNLNRHYSTVHPNNLVRVSTDNTITDLFSKTNKAAEIESETNSNQSVSDIVSDCDDLSPNNSVVDRVNDRTGKIKFPRVTKP